MDTFFTSKNIKKHHCQKCMFYADKLGDFNRHLLTIKHKRIILDKMDTQNTQIDVKYINKFICNCGKTYTFSSGLSKHKKKCKYQNEHVNTDTADTTANTDTELLMEILNKDNEIKNFLLEQNKQLIDKLTEQNNKLIEQNNKLMQFAECNKTPNVITNTNNTTNNFNLNVFLNEKCKDALNITDFVESLVLKVNDLEETARLGYVNGISKIFINGLKKLDICKRPLHCSDIKRNTLYIKDDNQWAKESTNNPTLTRAIKKVSNKNFQTIFEWQKLHPCYNDSKSKQNDKYNKIICETISGSTKEEQDNNYDKIIRNVMKEVVIDK
jgi:hypothetical protein